MTDEQKISALRELWDCIEEYAAATDDASYSQHTERYIAEAVSKIDSVLLAITGITPDQWREECKNE